MVLDATACRHVAGGHEADVLRGSLEALRKRDDVAGVVLGDGVGGFDLGGVKNDVGFSTGLIVIVCNNVLFDILQVFTQKP